MASDDDPLATQVSLLEKLIQDPALGIQVLKQLDVAVTIINLQGTFVDANPRALTILGLEETRIVGRALLDADWNCVDEAGAPMPPEAFPAAITLRTGRTITDCVMGMPRPDGERVWLAVTTGLLHDPGTGAAIAVVASFIDVTRRKEAELQAERSTKEFVRQQALMARIIAEAPVGIGYMDRDLVFRWANPTLAQFLGVTPERMRDQHVFVLFPEAREQFGAIMHGVLDTGVPFRATASPFRYQVDGIDRTTYWDFTHLPLFDADGQPDGILVVNMEVSERVEGERLQQKQIEQLRQLDHMKDQFVSSVSHELRTPLTSIKGYLEFLEDGIGGRLSPPQENFVKQAIRGTNRLESVVDDLLDFARIDGGTFTLRLAKADFAANAREVLESFAPQALRKKLQLVGEVPPGPLELLLDADRIGQVFANLVGNALKFTPEGGTIRLVVLARGEVVRCEVHDTGIGIAAADMHKLFQRFSQLDTSNSRSTGGTGLGLNITKAIITSHGGQIGVDSEPGRGSTFWFEIPIVRVGNEPA